jgi:amino acid transporter
MTALNVVIEYWKPLHPAIIISVALVVLAVINLWSVHAYGEVEFWISISKLFLCLALTFYTLVTMLGGNPIGDRYGFRFWKDPGPFVGSGLHVIRGLFSAILWSAYA